MKLWDTLKRKHAFHIILLTGIAVLVIHVLLNNRYGTTAVLYVAVPFCIALWLAWQRERWGREKPGYTFTRFALDSLMVMLATSVLLFEGFICVLFFMPIYFLMVAIAYGIYQAARKNRDNAKGRIYSIALPLLVLLTSVEGTSEKLSFERANSVTVSRVARLSVAEIHTNLLAPIELQKDRPWFLDIFPMPYEVEAESLQAGDVHDIHYRYHRWFFMNTHEGRARLQIEAADERYVRTRFIEDTSYISNYMRLQGTEIQLDPLGPDETRITLTIHFERTLDPAWYFQPLQRYGIEKTGEFLLAEVIARDGRY